MKRVLYLLPVLLLFILSCSKDRNNPGAKMFLPATYASLSGTVWDLKSHFYSTGSAGQWYPYTESLSVRFLADSSYLTNNENQLHFTLTYADNDTILNAYKAGSTDTLKFGVKLSTDTLYLYNRRCIEGCGEKYVRQQFTR